ncbi:gasdermin-E [Bombina bombina]|uniref:gasdermin-E n=1 Tax=Bombina bombina TaxID=8345 RepID=UPI00235ABD0F|nr:gasdermin-E [Bombina bombina]
MFLRINLHHPFIDQLHENKNDILCVLNEKIVTTQKCVIAEHTQTEEKYGGKLGIKAKIVKVTVTENGNFKKDENTVLEIPAPTAIAYGVVELYIKHDGQFEFCLLSEKQGGFEKENTERHQSHDSVLHDTLSMYTWDVVDGVKNDSQQRKAVPCNASLHFLMQDITHLKKQFLILERLPTDQRQELYQMFCENLYDGHIVVHLQTLVEEICSGYKPNLTILDDLSPSHKQKALHFLHLIEYDTHNQNLHQDKVDILFALHLLISALDEITDSALATLGACCDLDLLPVLCSLPNITSDEGLCSRTNPLLSDFMDLGRFQIAQRLFTFSNLKLEMNEHTVVAATTTAPGFLPFILYIAICGLYALKYSTKEEKGLDEC